MGNSVSETVDETINMSIKVMLTASNSVCQKASNEIVISNCTLKDVEIEQVIVLDMSAIQKISDDTTIQQEFISAIYSEAEQFEDLLSQIVAPWDSNDTDITIKIVADMCIEVSKVFNNVCQQQGSNLFVCQDGATVIGTSIEQVVQACAECIQNISSVTNAKSSIQNQISTKVSQKSELFGFSLGEWAFAIVGLILLLIIVIVVWRVTKGKAPSETTILDINKAPAAENAEKSKLERLALLAKQAGISIPAITAPPPKPPAAP